MFFLVSHSGCVATPGGSLVEVVFVFTIVRPTHPVHEHQAPFQMASKSDRSHAGDERGIGSSNTPEDIARWKADTATSAQKILGGD